MTQPLGQMALEYAALGLPLLPGTWWDPLRLRYLPRLAGITPRRLRPVREPHEATRDPGDIYGLWTRRPYGLYMPTGSTSGYDVVEVPAGLGQRASARLVAAERATPMAIVPSAGTALLWCQAGMRPLDVRGATLHGDGGWVPLPGTPDQGGVVRAGVPLAWTGGRAVEPQYLEDALYAALEDIGLLADGRE
jgi:hypothetical protein